MKTFDVIGFIIGSPFVVIGWLISVIKTGYEIGYESFQLGEYKQSSIVQKDSLINSLLVKLDELKKDK